MEKGLRKRAEFFLLLVFVFCYLCKKKYMHKAVR